ncbi:MAG: hypothetical protein K5662_06270 [Lachnospiraceae bacterium]|nr:hypothetical protein [Lachnospiraceae bacterium]
MSSIRTGNLVKSYFLNRNDNEPRVIDGNSLVFERMEQMRAFIPEEFGDPEGESSGTGEFSEGLDADVLDALTSERDMGDSDAPQSNVIKAAPVPEIDAEAIRAEIIEAARAEAEAIKVEARDSIDRERIIAYEEGKESGYSEGFAAGKAEIDRMRQEIINEKAAIEKDYEDRLNELEPKFVHALTGIYEKIFAVDLSEHKEIILTLLRNTMSDIAGSKSYLIHVSRSDYEYVSSHKKELMTDSVLDGADIDVIEDVTLKEGDCMVETVNGIFDCSLGTELEGLRKRLELLSYTP